jgi:hypothetical protein
VKAVLSAATPSSVKGEESGMGAVQGTLEVLDTNLEYSSCDMTCSSLTRGSFRIPLNRVATTSELTALACSRSSPDSVRNIMHIVLPVRKCFIMKLRRLLPKRGPAAWVSGVNTKLGKGSMGLASLCFLAGVQYCRDSGVNVGDDGGREGGTEVKVVLDGEGPATERERFETFGEESSLCLLLDTTTILGDPDGDERWILVGDNTNVVGSLGKSERDCLASKSSLMRERKLSAFVSSLE